LPKVELVEPIKVGQMEDLLNFYFGGVPHVSKKIMMGQPNWYHCKKKRKKKRKLVALPTNLIPVIVKFTSSLPNTPKS